MIKFNVLTSEKGMVFIHLSFSFTCLKGLGLRVQKWKVRIKHEVISTWLSYISLLFYKTLLTFIFLDIFTSNSTFDCAKCYFPPISSNFSTKKRVFSSSYFELYSYLKSSKRNSSNFFLFPSNNKQDPTKLEKGSK